MMHGRGKHAASLTTLLGSLVLLVSVAAPAAEFVGTASCRGCHAAAYASWQGSHHDLAMQAAAPESVLGDFDDARYTYGAITSRFYTRDGNYYVRTDGPDGALREYPIRFTFGVFPLQQYLIPLADGRLQALGIAWDSRPADEGGQRWFHLYPGEEVDHEHELHWTGEQQNWNYMCAACHSTNVDKGYEPYTDGFDTTFSDVDVGCEACHGPGSQHVEWAEMGQDERLERADRGLTVTDLAARVDWTMDPRTGSVRPGRGPTGMQVEVCADCHSRRGELAPQPEADPHFLNHHMPAFLTEGLYHADGQIDDEVFVWGSFVQSRMHASGVVCSNCHEPHSLKLRAPGDAVCAQCHQPQRFANESHHHHDEGSEGSRCVSCHMPEKTYMVVDPRRDHAMRIPRPELSVELGIPNACNGCHHQETAEWAARHHADWYPGARDRPAWPRALAAARAGNPSAEIELARVVEDVSLPGIVRGTAMLELVSLMSHRSAGALEKALRDPSALVRIAGLRAAAVVPPEHRLRYVAELLEDPLLAVRSEAGRAAAAVPEAAVAARDRNRKARAVQDYIATQTYVAERPEAQLNLAGLYRDLGQPERAEASSRRALYLDETFVPAYVNLADLLRAQGRPLEAREILERGLEVQPNAPALHHALGLQLVRDDERAEALAALERAAALAPDEARYRYVYAIALNSSGESRSARDVLRTALEDHPFDRDILLALTTINLEAGDVDDAKRYLQRLLEIRPDDPDGLALRQALNVPP